MTGTIISSRITPVNSGFSKIQIYYDDAHCVIGKEEISDPGNDKNSENPLEADRCECTSLYIVRS